MTAELPKADSFNEEAISRFDHLKEVIAGIRTVRKQKQIPRRDSLELLIKGLTTHISTAYWKRWAISPTSGLWKRNLPPQCRL